MKNYSKAAAGRGKTTFRTGDRWRARKYTAVLRVKSKFSFDKLRIPSKVEGQSSNDPFNFTRGHPERSRMDVKSSSKFK